MLLIFRMAIRDLGRNRRRSFFSALALAIGLALLIFFSGIMTGEMEISTEKSLKLSSGHVQIRSQKYDENKTSLKWEDLLENPDGIAAKVATMNPVVVATPRLYANGLVTFGKKTVGLRIMGVDTTSAANTPYNEGLISGEFISNDDRQGIMIGKPLAEKFNLKPGDSMTLLINTSNGDFDEQPFTIRGIYSTGVSSQDKSTILMPLEKAQSITRTENHATLIFILLTNRDLAHSVANALHSSTLQIVTWDEIFDLLGAMDGFMAIFMGILSVIVLAMTSVVIVNTLIMSVRERTREIGILSAIGMKSRNILVKFLAETSLLAIAGTIVGVILGVLIVKIFSNYGYYLGDVDTSGFMIMPDTIYAILKIRNVITLSIEAFIITLVAGLIPSIIAARMEPVEALHGGK